MQSVTLPGGWKTEATSLLRQIGFTGRASGGAMTRGLALHAALMAVFGLAVPVLKGLDFFDPFILTAYACLPALLAAPLAAQPFQKPTIGRVNARITLSVLYGEFIALGATALGIAAVYWTHRGGVFFPPELTSLAQGFGFGFVLSLALSILAAWATLRFSAGASKSMLRVIFLGLLLWFWMRGRFLPEVIGGAGGVALGVALAFRLAIPSALARRLPGVEHEPGAGR